MYWNLSCVMVVSSTGRLTLTWDVLKYRCIIYYKGIFND